MPTAEGSSFAGIDVSGQELSVALRRGQGADKPAITKFPKHPSGHKCPDGLLAPGWRARTSLLGSQWELQPGANSASRRPVMKV